MNKTFGERIAEKRKSKGYTQEQLAEMMGVSAQAVSKCNKAEITGQQCFFIILLISHDDSL